MPKLPKPSKVIRPSKNKSEPKKARRMARARPAMGAVDFRLGDNSDRLARLAAALNGGTKGAPLSPRTARLLSAGAPKMAQKVIEEAGEVAIEAVQGDISSVIGESADLIFNLVVLWTHLGISPAHVWDEMDRRETVLGIAEKIPKPSDDRSSLLD